MKYFDTEWAIQEPVVEMDEDDNGNEIFNTVKHRWSMPIDKEGYDYSEVIELDAKYWHPGTIITISVPECPECGDEAHWGPDIGSNCDCGFNWKSWWEKQYGNGKGDTMSEFTSEDAIEFAEREGWKDMTFEQRAKFQMSHGLYCMPFSVFHEAVEKTLGRPVYTHEFALNWHGIKSELFDGAEPPSMTEILEMLPEDKTTVVVAGENNTIRGVLTREEALKISREVGERAEQERIDIPDEEVRRGLEYNDSVGD